MKKTKRLMVIVMVIILLTAVGCSNGSNEVVEKDGSFDNSPVNATIAHGSPTGLWFMLASGISESLGRSYEGSLLQLTPGNNLPNFMRLSEGSIDFGLTLTDTVYTGYNGIANFEEEHDDIGGVAIIYPSMLQFIVSEDKGVVSFEDFVTRRIPLRLSISTKDGSANEAFRAALGKYGLTVEDIEDWGCKLYEKGLKDTGELFADGAIDGLWVVAGAPTPAVVQHAVNEEMRMVTLSDELLDYLVTERGFSDYKLEGGSYEFEDNDFDSLCVYSMITASLNVSDETAYKLARSIHENTEYISTLHSALADFRPEQLLDGMPIPLHPGAEMYYKEIGMMD